MTTKRSVGTYMFASDDLRHHLSRQWEQKGYPIRDGERIGLSIEEIVSESETRNASVSTPYLDLWLAMFDEQVSWLISAFTVLYTDRDGPAEFTKFEKSAIVVLSKIVADSLAIRHLILAGFDVAANVVLRSLIHRPQLADEFFETDEPEAANKFWNRHVARAGLPTKMVAAWRDFFAGKDDETAEWFARWGRGFIGKMSTLSHPSFVGGMLSAIPLKTQYTEENWLGLFGDRSEGSAYTIHAFSAFMFPILTLSRNFPFQGYDDFLCAPVSYDDRNEFHLHVKVGRDILASMILSTCSETNNHVFPDFDLSIFTKRASKYDPAGRK